MSATSLVTGAAPAPAPVTSVDVTPGAASATVGQTIQLTAIPRDASGAALSGRQLSWSSTNTAVATVDQTGRVSAVGAGTATITATITATSEGKSGAAAVTVTLAAPGIPTPPAVGSVTVSPSSTSVVQGQATTLSTTVKDANGNVLTGRPVTWTFSNTQLGTVSATGLVTGPPNGSRKGNVTITASVEGVSGTAVLTVP